jgi:lysophospholipase L1-like esterase
MKKLFIIGVLLITLAVGAKADVDPNFYIYLCFGQSNMEGNAAAESVDKTVDSRFQMLAAQNFNNPRRTMGEWYPATPPIVRNGAGLGMADYFGRTMVAALPANVTVGVVDVAVGGIAIEGFMSDKVASYIKNEADWLKNLVAAYGNDPYKRLVDMAKIAQEKGVIKGILLHQGCSNNGQSDWPQKVKTIYDRLLNDLGLEAKDVPLFVGETLRQDQGGGCYQHNTVVAKMPSVVPTSYVVHSNGIPGNGQDPWHFSAAGYRTFGKRYAYEALKVMGREPRADAAYEMPSNLTKFFHVTELKKINDFSPKKGATRALKITAIFEDNHTEEVTDEAQIAVPDFVTYQDGKLKVNDEGDGDVTISYTDFMGNTVATSFHVSCVGTGIHEVNSDGLSDHQDMFDLNGRRVNGKQLQPGIYIKGNEKRIVR